MLQGLGLETSRAGSSEQGEGEEEGEEGDGDMGMVRRLQEAADFEALVRRGVRTYSIRYILTYTVIDIHL